MLDALAGGKSRDLVAPAPPLRTKHRLQPLGDEAPLRVTDVGRSEVGPSDSRMPYLVLEHVAQPLLHPRRRRTVEAQLEKTARHRLVDRAHADDPQQALSVGADARIGGTAMGSGRGAGHSSPAYACATER